MAILELNFLTLQAALAFVPAHEWPACLDRVEAPGRHYALEHHGNLLAIGGLNLAGDNLGDPWLLLTPHGRRHPLTTYKAVRSMLIDGMEALGLASVQTMVRADLSERVRLVEHLGFVRESSVEYAGHTYLYYRGQRREGITDG